ncbi:MAG: Gfo/Idh/MocA family oxidoreductase [Dehalococcoidia bacterium]|nr:Gfo/Idh/MocA family oxidoreductase [Dehalococcoidia bacterium]
MDRQVKVGVIGLGAMGKNHARIYFELPEVELVGVADVNYGLAQSLAVRYHAKPFNDYQKLLEQDLDAVSIAVPTSLHKEVAMNAAHAGVSMLVEKPIAGTVASAKEIIKAAQENNAKLMVGHVERFNPVTPIIKKEIENDGVSLIEVTRIGPFPPRVKDVGVVTDLATHDIDLIRYLTGSEFSKIYSLTSRSLAQHEDAAILLFEMANGVLARVTVNWLTPFKVREITVATKEKFIKASLIDQKVTEYSKYKENDSYLVKELNVPFREPLKLELQAFIDSIRNNTELLISGADGLRALEVAGRCLKQQE